jgi:hypothetical protein
MKKIRNRIKGHRTVKARDLVPHELNPRTHPSQQRTALRALYREVGFARSLLAYELPDGRLKLIDGHLRKDIDPDMEVTVEVLDVTDAEARQLLLSIDPLAALARCQEETLARLRELTPPPSEALAKLWDTIDRARAHVEATLDEARNAGQNPAFPEQYLILIECADESAQRDLLERFQAEGLKCRALAS